ncbi:hypothetical protein JXR01_01470 [Candidatus Kaiserbacteria bacterium]|nr:MAG: hypothetical protein JXR01_01470 [Candidatus Kaiserbacteria bacterium]
MEEILKEVRTLLEAETLVPVEVSSRLKLAVNSLFAANVKLLALDDSEICALMEKHPGVREIFEDSDPKEIAWALRLANETRNRSG